MDLKTYFKSNRQVEFAKLLGVTPGAVNQWVNGSVILTADRCIQIEKATGGLVRCEELNPNVPWEVLRTTPELTTQPQPTTQGA